MKTPKELDVLRRIVWFEDTPEIVSKLKQLDLKDEAKHLHRMHIYHKNLIAEIRKLRRELRARGQPEPWVKTYSGGKPNYTEPKEWVGLTDEEIEDLWGEPVDLMYSGNYNAIRAIEAKLKEKNNA